MAKLVGTGAGGHAGNPRKKRRAAHGGRQAAQPWCWHKRQKYIKCLSDMRRMHIEQWRHAAALPWWSSAAASRPPRLLSAQLFSVNQTYASLSRIFFDERRRSCRAHVRLPGMLDCMCRTGGGCCGTHKLHSQQPARRWHVLHHQAFRCHKHAI